MNRRTYLAALSAGGLAGCLGGLRGGGHAVGDTATAGGLAVTVTDYTIVDDADLNSNEVPDADASILLVEFRVGHTGGNERAFPHPTTNGIAASYDGEPVPNLYTSSNITADGTEYTGYANRYQQAGADEAYKGTTVEGWVSFEVPPDADPARVSVTVAWRGAETHERTWDLD